MSEDVKKCECGKQPSTCREFDERSVYNFHVECSCGNTTVRHFSYMNAVIAWNSKEYHKNEEWAEILKKIKLENTILCHKCGEPPSFIEVPTEKKMRLFCANCNLLFTIESITFDEIINKA